MSKINTTKIFKGLANYDYTVITELASDEIGILLSAIITIGVFGSITIYSRSYAMPAVLGIILVPVAISLIAPQVSQIMTQLIVVITALYLFRVIARRY